VPNSGTLSPGYGAVPDPNATNVIYTTNTTTPSWGNNQTSGRILLGGPDADIEINGESIVDTLKQIKEQLQIPNRLNRNSKLEAEFEELKQLGEQYRDLETKFREQKRVFDILKKQD
jgi:hypothetical protein